MQLLGAPSATPKRERDPQENLTTRDTITRKVMSRPPSAEVNKFNSTDTKHTNFHALQPQ